MGVIRVTYCTDPACPWSWAAEPAFARLEVEFLDRVAVTFVMGGFAREVPAGLDVAPAALDAGAASGMPGTPADGWSAPAELPPRVHRREGGRRAGPRRPVPRRLIGACGPT